MEAARILGWEDIPAVVSDGTETEAKMWEIAENLHWADLTDLERSEHVAEWIRLWKEEEGVPRQVDAKLQPKGGRPQGGIRAASRALGLEPKNAERSVKINGICDEAKEAIKEAAKLDDNQSALLRVAAQPSPEAQLAAVWEKQDRDEAQKRNRDADKRIASQMRAELKSMTDAMFSALAKKRA